jgi:predicted nucleotide-binding protein (sugar kinase/HSP70/actin superfamily)
MLLQAALPGLKEAISNIHICEEAEWVLVTSTHQKSMSIALFKHIDPNLRTRIHFHAFCCGIQKIGTWELKQDLENNQQLQFFAETLVSSFQADVAAELRLYSAALETLHREQYVLHQ